MVADDDGNEPSADELEVASILERYQREQYAGADPDPAACLSEHPELTAALGACLHGLAAMEELRAALQVPAAAVPRAFGAFHIVREIGRGGMGVVYEAIHEGLQRRVALKVLKAGTLADAQEHDLFHKEARATAALQHPNIVQIFEIGAQDGQPFLVMEYMSGGNLADHLDGAPLEPSGAARLVAVLAHAMELAHERGIIHRDLKPANILLTAGPEPLAQPKIADFGLAKHLYIEGDQSLSGTIKGTPSYMAPEQASGSATTAATDVYALGVVLYETLTGRPPFCAARPLDTLQQVLALEPVAPRRLQPSVPRDLNTICLKCLCKEPARRYATARELAEDLERFLRYEPIRARPPGVSGRLWRWVRRNPVVASLLGVAALLTVAVAALLGLRLLEGREQRARVLADNVFAANHLANTILVELWKMAETVDRAASDPELRRLLKEDRAQLRAAAGDGTPARPRYTLPEDQRRLQPYLARLQQQGGFAFHSWHVVDKDGILLADAPQPQRSVFGVSFQGRDYFLGALQHRGTRGRARVHVSRAYQSANDALFKITLSALIYDEPDGSNPIGVLCATLPTNATLGLLSLTDAEHVAVLVGCLDTNDPHRAPAATPLPMQLMILVHPAYGELPEYGQGKKAVFVPQELLPLLPQRAGNHDELVPRQRSALAAAQQRQDGYADPLGQVYPDKYGGRWLAGFAQVGNTEMVVIVQRRREEWSSPSWLAPGAGALLALGLAAVAWRRLRRRRRGQRVRADAAAPTEIYAPPAAP